MKFWTVFKNWLCIKSRHKFSICVTCKHIKKREKEIEFEKKVREIIEEWWNE